VEAEPLRPQRALGTGLEIAGAEWLFEPEWRGERVLATYRTGRVTLTDAQGRSCTDRLAEAAERLEAAIDARQAVVDGIWSDDLPPVGPPGGAPGFTEEVLARGGPNAFVAVDLLEVDGQSLLDVPLLERKRLLAGVVIEAERVRVTPSVRFPIHSSLLSWRMNGFTTYIAKHENSRYLPGETNPEWLRLAVRPQRRVGLVGRMFGARPRPEPPPRR
jgi:bifunctional non-homologous end joining protein LigD